MRKRIFNFFLVLSICSLNWSCTLFHPESLNRDENGYLTRHYVSCGPRALEKAFREYANKNKTPHKKNWTKEEISRKIQDSGNTIRLLSSLVHHDAVLMTIPSEIENVIKKFGFEIIDVKSFDLLKKEVDVAIILVGGNYFKGDLHWVCFPVDKRITDYFGKNTKILKIFLLKKVD